MECRDTGSCSSASVELDWNEVLIAPLDGELDEAEGSLVWCSEKGWSG